MIRTTTSINTKLGLHARASAKLTKVAASYPCTVWMSRGDRRVNAKSIMGVMMLAAGTGTPIVLRAEGVDETDALAAVADLFARKFDEGA
jgi:phosphocarrier protein